MQKSHIKAVFFDLDDTLFDYEVCHQAASAEIFREIAILTKTPEELVPLLFEFDYEVCHQAASAEIFREIAILTKTPEELVPLLFELAQKEVKTQLLGTAASHNKDLYFQKIFEKMNSQLKNKILPAQIIHIFDLYRKVFYKTIKREKPTIQLLKFLKRKGIKTWIVTDSSNYTQLKKMVRLGISDVIDVMVSSEEAGMDKPHSSPFLLAMYKLDVKAQECLMVGDNILRDIDGAQWLGIQGIWLNRYQKSSKGVCPNYTVNSTQELYDLLKKIV